MQTAVDRCGALHIVFNNAGIGGYGKAPDLDVELWRKILSVDLDGVFYGCKYAIPHMRRAGGGAIVNTASISGLFGDYGFLAYNAAKGAVVNLTRTIAIDHAKEGIRCNCVCPGAIDTAIFQQIAVIPGALEAYTQCIPMGAGRASGGGGGGDRLSRLGRRLLHHGSAARHRWRGDGVHRPGERQPNHRRLKKR